MENFYAMGFRKTRINADFRKSRLVLPAQKNIATLNATSHVLHPTHGARSVSDERAGASYERPFVKSISQKNFFSEGIDLVI